MFNQYADDESYKRYKPVSYTHLDVYKRQIQHSAVQMKRIEFRADEITALGIQAEPYRLPPDPGFLAIGLVNHAACD